MPSLRVVAIEDLNKKNHDHLLNRALHRRNVSIYIHATIPGWVDFCLDIDYMYQRPPHGGTSTRQSLEDDVSPFANHLYTSSSFFDRPKMPCTSTGPKTTYRRLKSTLQLPEAFQFAMGLLGFDTTYRRPLNAVSTCGSR
ncbi:hypothetical protein K443DRAFT_16167 [Laccaria amethystina LaAM-08-1]|uniref:Uncharacterized protein n=1 Tax=Laccaria amethystina LaAM-08-1 TaxID=1095629 RepID=A0A0C9WVX7_9AGAR|nr:hypothetical protein K443DRAFT_16167 [Laccaria amethystina LaAM-08-1]